MRDKIVGILGGMGPEATLDLMQKVISSTPAEDDKDHIRLVVDNNPKIPSRIKALIEKTGESPLTTLQDMAKKLSEYGADFLAMPCNTAHLYHEQLQESISIPLLDMIQLTFDEINNTNINNEKVGIIASNAIIDLQIYEKKINSSKTELIYPQKDYQNSIMDNIKSIKSGCYNDSITNSIQSCIENLEDQEVDIILIACTEISIINNKLVSNKPLYDVSQILADNIVKKAKTT